MIVLTRLINPFISIIKSCFLAIIYSFSLDVRSLAIFRIWLGLSSFGDVIDRMVDLQAHYTDAGVHRRVDIMSSFDGYYYFVIHWINGTWAFAAVLFTFHLYATAMVTIGWKTKIHVFIIWVLTMSLHEAFPFVGHSGDVFHRILLFWSLFLPVGKVYSVDSVLNSWKKKSAQINKNRKSFTHFSVASIGLLLHPSFVYISSFYHKTGTEWTTDHTAVFYALNHSYFQTIVAKFLLTFPEWVLKTMCVITLYWEHYGSLIFLIPIKNDYFKLLGSIGFWALHLGFGTALRLGLFFWITMTLYFAFIPPLFWDKFIPWIRTKERMGVKVYYNNYSGFSRGLAVFLKCFMIEETHFLPLKEYNSLPLKSEKEYHEDTPEDAITISIPKTDDNKFSNHHLNTNWLVVTRNHSKEEYMGAQALVLCLKLSPLLRIFGWLAKLIPNIVAMIFESWAELSTIITLHSSLETKIKAPTSVHPVTRLYKKQRKGFKKVLYIMVQLGLLYLIFLMFCWNMSNLGHSEWAPTWQHSRFVWLFRLDQCWNMFSPQPPRTSFWYFIEGELVNEKKVELFKNGGIHTFEYSYDMNDELTDFVTAFGNHRWFKYFENGYNQHDRLREPFGRYLCREFNGRNPTETQLWTFKIWAMSHTVDYSGKWSRTGQQLMWEHKCFDNKPFWIPPRKE